ncbi:hypothetical protein AKO1_007919 [Acrasis kona]|uniref:N-acetyltransferase domain-containing protein n=1 Tax=Acrasis kona TaxID=1008807 RepID=A0AAW2YQ51_9EUKA
MREEAGWNKHLVGKWMSDVEKNDLVFWIFYEDHTMQKAVGSSGIDLNGLDKDLSDPQSLKACIAHTFVYPEHRGKGYGREIALTCINYAFQELNLKEVTVCIAALNVASLKLFLSLGFEEFKRKQMNWAPQKPYDATNWNALAVFMRKYRTE